MVTLENRGGSAQHATRATPTRSSHGPDESLALCHPYLQPYCVSHCSVYPGGGSEGGREETIIFTSEPITVQGPPYSSGTTPTQTTVR